MFIIFFLFLVSPFYFYFFYFLRPDPPPATRYPSPATRHPSPAEKSCRTNDGSGHWLQVLRPLLGSFSTDDGDGKENVSLERERKICRRLFTS